MIKYFFNKFLFNNKFLNYIIFKYFFDSSIKPEQKKRLKSTIDFNYKNIKSDVSIVFRELGKGPNKDRYTYQKEYVNFNIKKTDKVLDIGSGGYPFPLATHLADLYLGDTTHRTEKIVVDNRPLIECNIEKMPFNDKEFDFTYCSHLLEHVENPHVACEEIMRISKRGYIETPTRTSDIMFNFTKMKNHHKWHIVKLDNTLVFMEWCDYERRDMGDDYFFIQSQSKWKNHFQEYFNNNRDIFCNMLLWDEKFWYIVINNKGEIINKNS